MKFNMQDIVLIKSLKKEGMILEIALDLETKKEKYIICSNSEDLTKQEILIYSDENDMELITTLDKMFEDIKKDFEVAGNA